MSAVAVGWGFHYNAQSCILEEFNLTLYSYK
jgi:hypothetical protein